MDSGALRLGNIVKAEHEINCSTQHGFVIGIKGSSILWKACDHDYEQEDLDIDVYPVELTEEILLKAGFIKEVRVHSYYRVHSENNFIIELYYDNAAECIAFMVNKVQRKEIEYLHQLQNLYHALTGQELQISL